MKYQKLRLQNFLFIFLFSITIHTINAQVLVSEEPRHHPIFQNDQIRILNVLIPPGDTSQYHIHHTPSVFVFLSNGLSGGQLKGAAPTHGKITAGVMYFENLSPPHTRVHRVWNEGKDTFHVQDIELLSKDTGFYNSPLLMKDLKLEIDTPFVRGYRLVLAKGSNFVLNKNDRSLVLISFDDANVQARLDGQGQDQILKPGSFFKINKGQSFSLKNNGDNSIQFALLELPG